MKIGYLFFAGVSVLLGMGAVGEAVELAYDTGNPDGYFNDLDSDDREGVCFTPMHPCSLLSVSLRTHFTGEIEVHVWGDDGAHAPDQDDDLVDPIVVAVEEEDVWIDVDLSEFGIVFDPPQDFHIGHHARDDGPVLWVDDADQVFEERSHLWTYNNGLRQYLWHNLGGNGNYMVRATVAYFDEREDYTFREVSEEAGIRGIGKSAWGDYDNDGWEDLLVNGRTLYRNLGDGTFDDVSEEAGIAADNPAGSGTWGDFDDDGWLDIYAVNSRDDAEDRLYHNNSDGTFSFANDAYALHQGNTPTAACGWGDANNDGALDLYVANSEHWNDGNPVYYRDYMFTFVPDFGEFFESTPEDIGGNRHYGRSVAWCDFDFDGDMDVYISNYRLHPNYLLVNQGVDQAGFPVFENEAGSRRVEGYRQQGAFGHTIGSSWGDYDNDGDFDLLVGNFAHPWGLAYQDKIMLCRNDGAPNYRFTDMRAESGIAYCETVFCPQWGDYDNDGWLDLFISSVYNGRQPFLYRNNGDGTFANVNYVTGFHGQAYNSSGVTWCDYDHDGDLDLAIGNAGLYENTGHSGNWLQVSLRGGESNAFGFGAYARVYAGEFSFLRQVEGGSGAEGCQNMMALHYGLGDAAEVDSLVVTWLSGTVDRYYGVAANRRYYAVEGGDLLVNVPQRPMEPTLPDRPMLAALYPNPFNGSVTVSFRQARAGKVRVEVYSPDGREVATLTDGVLSGGEHRFVWDADRAAAGNYLIQVRHTGGVLSRRAVLVR